MCELRFILVNMCRKELLSIGALRALNVEVSLVTCSYFVFMQFRLRVTCRLRDGYSLFDTAAGLTREQVTFLSCPFGFSGFLWLKMLCLTSLPLAVTIAVLRFLYNYKVNTGFWARKGGFSRILALALGFCSDPLTHHPVAHLGWAGRCALWGRGARGGGGGWGAGR